MSNGCATVEAMDRQTDAINRLVDELKTTREAFTPAADALHSLGEAQVKLCNFIVGNRLKIVTGIVGALVTVGAISPNAATVIGGVLKAWGLQ